MFKLIELPFHRKSLEPYMSEETINFHYGAHHKIYVDNLNSLVKNTRFEKLSIEEIINQSSGSIFNNAAQIWNHNFYWHCLSPKESNPNHTLKTHLEKSFGSISLFRKSMIDFTLNSFGCGWSWLVYNLDNTKLEIIRTKDADCPLVSKTMVPLLTCDFWEHAYYIDHRNSRLKYLENYFHIINWDSVSKRLKDSLLKLQR